MFVNWEEIDWRENQKQSIDPPGVVVPMGAIGCNGLLQNQTGIVVPMGKAHGVR